MAGLAALLHTSTTSDLFASGFSAPAPKRAKPPAAPAEPTAPEGAEAVEPEESRTVFVGNVPLDASKRDVATEFEKFGAVEKVWKRSVPVDRGKLSIAVACIRKKYKEDGSVCNFYVLFADKASAEKALAANGSLFHGNHLRVDLANAEKNHDPSLSVFVGNLPFSVKEEELWEEFAEFGTISYVRVIRDRQTHTGKGFAYVSFASKQSARMALSKHMAVFQGRPMRVFTCKKQVELNVQKRIKGRDAQGAKKRWKRREAPDAGPPEPDFEESGESMPPELFPRRKRKRDAGPAPAWKEMKREQQKLKTRQQTKKTQKTHKK